MNRKIGIVTEIAMKSLYRVWQLTFFLENAEYFLKFRFLFESTILPANNDK